MDADLALDWALVGAVTGVFGALTGLTALALQAWQFHLSGPRVKVSLANGFQTPQLSAVLIVEVTNVGRLPVTVAEVGLALSNGKRVPLAALNAHMFSGPAVPERLPDAEAMTWVAGPEEIARVVAQENASPEVRAYVRLATGKRKQSRKKMNVKELSILNRQ